VPPAARKRPRPMSRVTSISRSIGLENERYRYFKELGAALRNLASEHLDLHTNLKDQNPENWKKVTQLALERFPWLMQYEEAWPLKLIVQKYLHRTNCEYRKSQNRLGGERFRSSSRSGGGSWQPCTRYYTRSLNRVQRDAAQQASREHSSDAPRSPATHRGSGIQQSASIVVSGSTDLIQSNSRRLYSGNTSDSSQRRIYEKTPQSGVRQVKDFLKSLTPNLEGLADKFIAAGILNEECIKGLALMPDVEKTALLRDDLGLLPFYCRAVRVGLARKVAVESLSFTALAVSDLQSQSSRSS